MASRKLEVVFVGDTTSFDRATKKIGGGADKTESKLAKLGKAMAGAFAVQKIAAGTKYAINAATDLGEQVQKASVVFRGSEKGIVKWSKTTASSIGVSQRAALEAAGTFGNMLVPMGFARKDAAKMSQRMVQLGSDLASFNNASPEETLDALRAGLAGETEPLRRFGIFLNDARLKQEALSLGLYKGKGPLDAAAKAQATYSVILKDSKDAQGDFARTSGSLANQQRVLKAQTENLAAGMGNVLLPAAQKIATVAVKMLQGFQALPGPVQNVIAIGGALAITLGALGAVAGVLGGGLATLGGAFAAFAGVLGVSSLALGGIVLAVGAVAVAGYLLVKNWDTISAALGAAWTWTKNAASAAFGAVVGVISGAWHAVAGVTSAVWGGIAKVLSTYWSVIRVPLTIAFTFYREFITSVWGAISALTKAAWSGIKAVLVATWGAIRTAVSPPFNAVKGVVTGVWSAISSTTHTVWNALSGWLGGRWNTIRGVASGAWDGIRHVIVTPVASAIGWIKDAIGHGGKNKSGLIGWLSGAWDTITKGAHDFGGAVKGAVVGAFKGVVGKVLDFAISILDVVGKIPGVDFGGTIKNLKGVGKDLGIPGYARGGKVTSPGYFAGEEAPRHPEYIIPTNPAYRGRALGLLGQAASSLGIPGFAQGGVYGKAEIADIWRRANGDLGDANLMAAIALAESSGRKNAVGHDPGGTQGLGLWQITTGYNSDLIAKYGGRDAMLNSAIANAKAAGDILRRQGLGAWVVYNTGAYKKFTGGKSGGVLGALGGLLGKGADWFLDKLPGVGKLPGWLGGFGKNVLSQVGKWIKSKISGLLGGGGGGSVGKGVAGSISGAIAFARSLGFGMPSHGQLTGGKHAPGSYHYQGRAADFGHAGHSDAQMRALFSGFLGRYGSHIKELFYDPVGFYIKNGRKVGGAIGGHSDHLHLALAQGGVAPGGWVRVGELGAEWAQLPAGTRVHQASQSTSPPSGGPLIGELHVHGETDPRVLARELAWQVATAR